jgi:nucleoid DNA-binding protein
MTNTHIYSHLSNKREVTLTDFEKFHSRQKKNPRSTKPFFLKVHKNCLSYSLVVKATYFIFAI